MMSDRSRDRTPPKRISFFGNFGQGNLGNESTLRAILSHVRQHWPDAEINCICTGPEATTAAHGIPAVQMHDPLPTWAWLADKRSLRRLSKLIIGIPFEVYRWIAALRTLGRTDILIVPGTQFLSDNLTGPWGWPYLAFKWSLAAKLRRRRVFFVSVGVGPLRHPLSRLFVKATLHLADFRSYRDVLSKDYMRAIDLDPADDPVYPDLVFSLPQAMLPRHREHEAGQPLVVAVGVKDYRGQYAASVPREEPGAAYRRYLDGVAGFVAWLLEHKYTVRLVIGDVAYDPQVVTDVRAALTAMHVSYEARQLIADPIASQEDLIAQLAQSDIVVSTRFHNVLLGLLLDRPVIALSYHDKFAALLGSPELARYKLDLDHFDAGTVIGSFTELRAHSDELTHHIRRNVVRCRVALAEQYRLIFDDEERSRSRVASSGRAAHGSYGARLRQLALRIVAALIG
jgi:polysaccharide pyruvyl transferase WcaK-like protein